MATLYYGNGTVTIEGSDIIRGVEIRYRGKITIEDKTSDSFAIAHQNNGIMIFPIGEGTLNELFDYEGEIKINSVIVADNNGEKVPTSVKRVMDYSQLLNSKAEDMTVKSEDLSSGYISGTKPKKTSLKQHIVPNLHTSDWDVDLYYKDGTSYSGSFHIHLADNTAMSGSEHGKDSENLYYMRRGKLSTTRNASLIPQSLKSRKVRGRPKINRIVKKKGTVNV